MGLRCHFQRLGQLDERAHGLLCVNNLDTHFATRTSPTTRDESESSAHDASMLSDGSHCSSVTQFLWTIHRENPILP